MPDSVQPQRWQPTRLPRPWDSPRKNTGVGCHFLLQCMKMKSESEVAQSCLTLSNPMDCSLPVSSIHGTLQARVLEWGATAFSDTPTKIAKIQNTYIIKCCQGCRATETLIHCLWEYRMGSYFEDSLVASYKNKYTLTYDQQLCSLVFTQRS